MDAPQDRGSVVAACTLALAGGFEGSWVLCERSDAGSKHQTSQASTHWQHSAQATVLD